MKKYFTALLLTQICFTAYATSNNDFPKDLLFNGKPIDSLCFSNNANNTQVINLKNCGVENQKYEISGTNALLTKKGFTGYNWKDPADASPMEGYSYYKYFKANNNKYWIYAINSGGGSGEFTSVLLAERKDPNTIVIKTLAEGDRCNGGIQDVSEAKQSLTFSVNLTSYDLIALANQKLPTLKAYDDLAACATCCVAKAFYTVNNANKILNPSYVALGETAKKNQLPSQGKYAACFNTLLTSIPDKDKSRLNQDSINSLTKQFKQTCLKSR